MKKIDGKTRRVKYWVAKLNEKAAVMEKTPFTEVLIKTFLNSKEAQQLCSKLNRGSGFNGYTPNFLLDKKKEMV